MFIDLHRTVEKLGENLPRDGRITFGMLERAYELTLRLRSQLLSAIYDRIDFGSAPKRIIGEVSVSQTDSVVCLTIPEPLPGLKELNGTVEDHWRRMIHEAIARQSKTCNPKGFCEDNLPLQMAEQNSQGRGEADTASSSNPHPSRAVMRFLFAYQIQCWLILQHTLAVINCHILTQNHFVSDLALTQIMLQLRS